ncbi:MAG: hypothetical protein LBD16_01230 [Oscillospiraceae bacterium]|jgi:hypothetical protein|nr:hypothetical protein [Oscillospiraceae bacterium]
MPKVYLSCSPEEAEQLGYCPLTSEDVINNLLVSIAMEEMGVSHIINAIGENLQYVIDDPNGCNPSADEMIKMNEEIGEALEVLACLENSFVCKTNIALQLSGNEVSVPNFECECDYGD